MLASIARSHRSLEINSLVAFPQINNQNRWVEARGPREADLLTDRPVPKPGAYICSFL